MENMKYLVIFILASFAKNGFGQAVGGRFDKNDPYYRYHWVLNDEDYSNLKRSTVYFVYQENMDVDRDSLEVILNEAWDYTDIKVIEAGDLDDYIGKENCAFFSIQISRSEELNRNGFGKVTVFHGNDYNLWALIDPSKGFIYGNTKTFATFKLSFNCKFHDIFFEKGEDVLYNHLYNNAEFRELKSGIVANYLRVINSYLTKEIATPTNDVLIKNNPKLKQLKTKTLYITDNVNSIFDYRKDQYICCETDQKSPLEKTMKNYPYKYEIISYDELNEKILNGEDFVYAICTKFRDKGEINIFDNQTSDYLFTGPTQYCQFDPGYFVDLNRAINSKK